MGRRESESDDERRRRSSSSDRSRSRSQERRRERERDESRSRDGPGRKEYRRSSDDSPSMSSKDREALRSLWKTVKSDESNFDAWTHLLSFVERIDDISHGREAYGAFLEKYPYCYGYWKKFAEFERRHKNYERALEVYEKSVTSFPLSVDLWMAYLAYVKEIAAERDDGASKVRALYERALSVCGLEFRSDTLWDECVNFELNAHRASPRRALALLDRVIRIPTLYFNTHFEKIQQIINSYEPDEIVSEDEYEDALERVKDRLNSAAYTIESNGSLNGDAENGSSGRRKHSQEALSALRTELLAKRQKYFQATEKEVSRRWSYEEAIKRPYFHVKPLERSQLRTWRSYLEFEEKQGDKERIEVLYERCLIACAMYEDFWIKYTRWMQNVKKSSDAIRAVFKRGCEVHCCKKPSIHIANAAFEEAQGNFDAAMRILHAFEREQPGYPSVALRRIGLERRKARADRASSSDSTDYTNVIARYEKLIHDPKTSRVMASFYALKFARFQVKTRNDRKLAEKILKDALHRDRDNVQLHTALIDLHFSESRFSMSTTLAAIDDALKAEIPELDRIRFSQRKMDLLEDFSNDINAIQEYTEVHTTLVRNSEHRLQGMRRKASERPSEDDPAEKRVKLESLDTAGGAVNSIPTIVPQVASGGGTPNFYNTPPPQVSTSGYDASATGAAVFDPMAAQHNFIYPTPAVSSFQT